MSEKVIIEAGDHEFKATLYDNQMAEDIKDSLPITGSARTWGNEIYFPISVKKGYSGKEAVVNVGELAFWEPGNAFCIFFGVTPSSVDNEPRPANPVNVFGKIENIEQELANLKSVSAGTTIEVKRAN